MLDLEKENEFLREEIQRLKKKLARFQVAIIQIRQISGTAIEDVLERAED